MTNPTDILSAFPDELTSLCTEMGLPGYRGQQLFQWIHRKKVMDPSGMLNLPGQVRETLSRLGPICPVQLGMVHRSADGTRKIQIRLSDGAAVETVLIPEEGKLTQCISSQVGCSIGCVFCRSGMNGFVRNLTAAEIIGQVLVVSSLIGAGEKLSNVVFMGVGEPLHNYDNVLRAYRLLTLPEGTGLSYRRVTISTAGVLAGIERLGRDTGGKASLAVSIHAADEALRQQLVPHLKTTLAQLVSVLRRYPLPPRQRLTIEYVLMAGVNDRPTDALQLVKLLSPLRVKVNLLPLNPHEYCAFQPPEDAVVHRFQSLLMEKGLSVFLRKRRGDDIHAACGQLLSEK